MARGFALLAMMENKYYKIAAVIVLAAIILGAVLVLIPWPSHNAGATEFQIEKGQPLGKTARLLAEQNLIDSRYVFVAYTVLTGQEKNFKAGKYVIPQAASVRTLVNMFSQGLSKPEDIEVTIPEGTNLADIGLILSKAGLAKKGDFLSPEILKKEGYLFPDTYRFGRDANFVDIVTSMENNFGEKIKSLGNLSAKQLQRAVIVASILEKEVRTEGDMRLVAGVIEKRLAKGMPLEIDATVAYGACYQKFSAGQYCDTSLANIVDGIKSDSAFNTYKEKGLPPAPISNPGLKAIQAALNPQPSDYLYYLTTKDGTTIFSKTASEHLKARAKYLQ